jgi:hypothetical protein
LHKSVLDRLDEVLGPDGWQNDLEFHENGTVLCRLRIRVNGEWLVKADVGAPSEQPDEGDRCKAAASDGLKRAAVLWGIGRYLYRLPAQWLDYDPKAKRFTSKPQLPAWALPGKDAPDPQPTESSSKDAKPHALPADGLELEKRLRAYDAQLAEQGLCMPGEVSQHVIQTIAKMGPKPGYGRDLRAWPEQAIKLAAEEATAFGLALRMKEERKRATAERLQAADLPDALTTVKFGA